MPARRGGVQPGLAGGRKRGQQPAGRPRADHGQGGKPHPAFTAAPDFENPSDAGADNTYRLRIHNVHNLHNPGAGGSFPSCSGSAVDFTVKIKDVGLPADITPTASFRETDRTVMDISWEQPTGFMENTDLVMFPHESFHPSSYEYRRRESGDTAWPAGMATTLTTAQITGLTGDAYEIQVRAVNSEGTPDWPEEVLTVSVTRKPPDRPGRPVLAGSTATGLNVEWNKPEDNGSRITAYTVRRQKQGESAWKDRTYPGSVTSAHIAGLDPGTVYQIRVTARNDGGRSPWSPILEARTQDLPAPDRPGRPVLAGSTTTGLSVEWNEPENNGSRISAYIVHYRKQADTEWTNHPHSGSVTSVSVSGLKPGTAYEIRVKARNAGGASPWSPILEARTRYLSPDRPGRPALAGSSTTGLNVEWNEPEDNGSKISAYIVHYRKQTDTEWTDHPHSGSVTSAYVAGLDPGTAYEIRVKARNAGGRSPWSPVLEARTQNLPPPEASVTPDQTSVDEGQNAHFTITLSRTIDTVVNLNVTFTNGYGQDHSAQVTITGSNQAGFTVQTSRSASIQHGVVTVTLEEGAGYVPGDPNTAHAGVSRRPEPPVFHSAPTVEPVSTTRIRVTWPEPDSDHLQVTGYGVQYRNPGRTGGTGATPGPAGRPPSATWW